MKLSAIIIGITLGTLLAGALWMFMWNIVLPVFYPQATALTYWQACCMSIFASFITQYFRQQKTLPQAVAEAWKKF